MLGRTTRICEACSTEGFPCYPLFAKDPALDPVRNDPSFIRFMAGLKERWERFRAMV